MGWWHAVAVVGGGVWLRSVVIATARQVDDDRTRYLPPQCRPYVVKTFASLSEYALRSESADGVKHSLEAAGRSSQGGEGGAWSACTHLKIYGLNFAVYLARHLAFGLRPRRVLELGCGLGTTADFLARFVPGGSKVVCVEPEPMLAELFGGASSSSGPFRGGGGGGRRWPLRPAQVSVDVFDEAARPCVDALFSELMFYDLVLSLEVAEHVDPRHTAALIELLALSTVKHLVFSAARPRQGGTGHLDGSMHPKEWWIDRFTEAGLVYLPNLSASLRRSAKSERAYDLGGNIIAFGAPGVADAQQDQLPPLADCHFFHRPFTCTNKEMMSYLVRGHHKYTPADYKEMKKRHAAQMEGQVAALWPELDFVVRRVKAGLIEC